MKIEFVKFIMIMIKLKISTKIRCFQIFIIFGVLQTIFLCSTYGEEQHYII